MWLFTKLGFFSAVCARQGRGSHDEPIDRDRIMVRARVREHLEALRQRFAQRMANCEIHESPKADYAFRVFLPKSDWPWILSELANDIDYDNFKSAVAEHQGGDGQPYEKSLHEVWSVMHRLQTETNSRQSQRHAWREADG